MVIENVVAVLGPLNRTRGSRQAVLAFLDAAVGRNLYHLFTYSFGISPNRCREYTCLNSFRHIGTDMESISNAVPQSRPHYDSNITQKK
jgi:hypothetical protein